MPGIENDLNQIRSALYGREVREALAHGLQQCYSDVTSGKTIAETAAETAADQVDATIRHYRTIWDGLEELAETATDNANTAAQQADSARDRALAVIDGFEIASDSEVMQELGIT